MESFEILEVLANLEQPGWANDAGSAELMAMICTESTMQQLAQL